MEIKGRNPSHPAILHFWQFDYEKLIYRSVSKLFVWISCFFILKLKESANQMLATKAFLYTSFLNIKKNTHVDLYREYSEVDSNINW